MSTPYFAGSLLGMETTRKPPGRPALWPVKVRAAFTVEQAVAIQNIAESREVPMAQIVREAVAEYIAKNDSSKR